MTVLGTPTRAEHVFEQTRGYVAEAYVPVVLGADSQVAGVIETYKDMSALVQGIRRTQRSIWAVGSVMGLFLYVALAVVVWKASAGELRAISRLEESNKALLEAQAQLVEQERLAAVGQVVVGLHHSILNPLTGILGALQVLKHTLPGSPEQARAIVEAEDEVRKIERLVKRLPDLQSTTITPYLGKTTMLDLEPARGEEPQSTAGRRSG